MRRHGVFAAFVAGIVWLVIWLFLFGGMQQVEIWAAGQQREVQNALAQALRAVRGGEAWAVLGLLGLCFAYGFFHAAGPGHGKLVMGGYALGEDVPRGRLIGLTLAGALGQAITAIVLVYTGVLLLGWSRAQMTELADGNLAAVSAGAIVLVGLWLVWRGVRRWIAARTVPDHVHEGDGETCTACGHAHGPTTEQVRQATDWRQAAGVVLAVAIRPCTGALFVLILTYGMGIAWVGVLGAVTMALGTAVLTLGVALGAGHLRGGLAARLDGTGGLRAMAGIEILAGGLVALFAGQLMLRLI